MRLMHNSQKSGNAGFTLVELMVTIALMALVLTMTGSFFNFSTIFEKKAESEFDFQSSMRLASTILNNSIRDASVTFIIPEKVFSQSKMDGWDYLGVESGKEIVQYVWNKDKNGIGMGGHDRIVLVTSSSAISYNLFFKQNKPDSKLLEFTLNGIDNGSAGKKLEIKSEISAINSLTVDDGGSNNNPAVAVAYRSDPTPKPQDIVTKVPVNMLVVLVIDKSGSMGTSLGNGTRLSVMKTEVNNLINDLKIIDNSKVSVVAFSNTANQPLSLVTVTDSSIQTALNNMHASGGTNTGDGLRRAYYQIQNYKATHSQEKFVSYVILLTDGNPTYKTSSVVKDHYQSNYSPRINDGDILNPVDNYIFGDGGESASNVNDAMGYVRTICTNLLAAPSSDVMTFTIGFSSVAGGFENIKEIARISNNDNAHTYYYEANGSAELKAAFEEITTTMVDNMWHIYGPYPI